MQIKPKMKNSKISTNEELEPMISEDYDYEYDDIEFKIVIQDSEPDNVENIVETIREEVDNQYEVIDYSFNVINARYTYVIVKMKVQIEDPSDTDFIEDIINFASDDENEWDTRDIIHNTSFDDEDLDESANITDICPDCHKDPCECDIDEDDISEQEYDADHSAEWIERHPYGYYNSENDYGEDEDDIVEEEYDDDYESDFDDGSVTAGDTFDYDGIEYEWVQQYGDVAHLDFDSWAIWEACPIDNDEDEPECKFFIVDVDTEFIDWECDTLEEAKEFLQSKIDDYELDEDLEADVKKCNDEFIDKGMSQIKRGIDKIPMESSSRRNKTIVAKALVNALDDEDIKKAIGSLLSIDKNLYKKAMSMLQSNEYSSSYVAKTISDILIQDEATNPGAIPNHPCKHKRCKDIDECDEELEVNLDEDFQVVHEEMPENGDSNAQEVNAQLASFYDQLNTMGQFFVGSENKDVVQSIKDLQSKLKDLKV